MIETQCTTSSDSKTIIMIQRINYSRKPYTYNIIACMYIYYFSHTDRTANRFDLYRSQLPPAPPPASWRTLQGVGGQLGGEVTRALQLAVEYQVLQLQEVQVPGERREGGGGREGGGREGGGREEGGREEGGGGGLVNTCTLHEVRQYYSGTSQLKRSRLVKQNGANFSFIASSSEEL